MEIRAALANITSEKYRDVGGDAVIPNTAKPVNKATVINGSSMRHPAMKLSRVTIILELKCTEDIPRFFDAQVGASATEYHR